MAGLLVKLTPSVVDPCPTNLAAGDLVLDVAWEHNGVQYPANWLRLSTAQDRAGWGLFGKTPRPLTTRSGIGAKTQII